MKRLLLALAFILVVAGGAYAQESEISGGGGGSSSVGPGTAGAIPKFASTTTLGDSKLVTSGTNGGTLTLYDDTAVTGATNLKLRQGAVDGEILTVSNSSNTKVLSFETVGMGLTIGLSGSGQFSVGAEAGNNSLWGGAGGLHIPAGGSLFWYPSAFAADDLGLARASAGVLKVTDGSSGYGALDIAKVQGWQTKTLTESAATGFVDIALAQNTVIGGYVEYVVRTTNGTDYSVESGQLFFTGASKTNGTVDDADVGLVGTPIQSTTTANSWTNTFSVTKGTNKITLNCQSDSTLTSTDTITLFYRVHLNGAQTETITGL